VAVALLSSDQFRPKEPRLFELGDPRFIDPDLLGEPLAGEGLELRARALTEQLAGEIELPRRRTELPFFEHFLDHAERKTAFGAEPFDQLELLDVRLVVVRHVAARLLRLSEQTLAQIKVDGLLRRPRTTGELRDPNPPCRRCHGPSLVTRRSTVKISA